MSLVHQSAERNIFLGQKLTKNIIEKGKMDIFGKEFNILLKSLIDVRGEESPTQGPKARAQRSLVLRWTIIIQF